MIEDILTKLISATEAQIRVTSENNELLRQCLAIRGTNTLATSAPVVETEKPKRGGKKVTEQRTDEHGKTGHEPEPVAVAVVNETPSSAVAEPVTAETEDRIINEEEAGVIRAAYRDGSKATSDVNAHKEGFTALRKEFGVENVTKLILSQYEEFLTRTKAL